MLRMMSANLKPSTSPESVPVATVALFMGRARCKDSNRLNQCGLDGLRLIAHIFGRQFPIWSLCDVNKRRTQPSHLSASFGRCFDSSEPEIVGSFNAMKRHSTFVASNA